MAMRFLFSECQESEDGSAVSSNSIFSHLTRNRRDVSYAKDAVEKREAVAKGNLKSVGELADQISRLQDELNAIVKSQDRSP